MILCYKCGAPIDPSSTNLCARCLNNTVDLASRVKKSMVIETCRGCGRYHTPPSSWKSFTWGSQDLLIFLLNRNKTLRKLNIIDSSFVYTEEHSGRIKIEILILEDAVEQPVLLEYTARNLQCPQCMRTEAKQFWKAIVQLRQHPYHKRTFMYIEQLMLQHKAHFDTSNIRTRKDGIDFYYTDVCKAQKMVDFIRGFFGIQLTTSSRLISLDVHNCVANKKHTFSVELLPFCIDDLVLIKDKTLGLGNVAVVRHTRSTTEFFDPVSGKRIKVPAKHYFSNRNAFEILLRSEDFKQYTVICSRKTHHGLYDVTVSENDSTLYDLSTHLPLREDGIVCGYDIGNLNLTTEVDLKVPVLLIRVEEDLENIPNDDREFRYLLTDISSDKNLLSSICGALPPNPVIEEFSKLQFSENN